MIVLDAIKMHIVPEYLTGMETWICYMLREKIDFKTMYNVIEIM